MTKRDKKALIMVDLQNDFCRGGSLAVPDADAVIPLANQLQPYFDLVVASQDWHPAGHMSFAANHPGKNVGDVMTVRGVQQIMWPTHCVQHTKGAAFHPELNTQAIDHVVHKGTDMFMDSYSAFFDNEHLRATGLEKYLLEHHVTDVYLMGLATDYCVKFSCLDAVKLKFKTHCIQDACRGVELKSGDVAAALRDMQEAGVFLITTKEIL